MSPNHLTDEELLRQVHNEHNPLTTTDLETELASRFRSLLDEQAANRPLVDVIEDFSDQTPKTVREALQLVADFPFGRDLLDVLTEFDIEAPEFLRKQLERISKFDQVMQDLAEPFTALQSLVTPE